ncbi:MAG: thioredoxin domain-containing protein [Ferruginibacter sp.]
MRKKCLHVNTAVIGFASLLILMLQLSCKSPDHTFKNHLQHASSPYLKEHADNPVDWYEWGDEALDKAKKENKPLLISIGYAACHWCHVMEEESFMDTAVARIMNENFICIKVDREERPDIDNQYSNILQLLTGSSGWPLNAFALPNGEAFFAGTYYQKKAWTSVLVQIAKTYKEQNKLVVTQADALKNGMADQQIIRPDSADLIDNRSQQAIYQLFSDSIIKHADILNGGLGGAHKFPNPAFVEFMLMRHYIAADNKALTIATTTLDKMALGGIYDQLGGGFARYTTDSAWRFPHFEKMLYDNGQMVSMYANGYQLTKNEFYKKVLIQTLAFVDKNMASPDGGYCSSINADSETGEGKYYSWGEKEFLNALNNEKIIAEYFHVIGRGNWENGKNVLYATQTPEEFATAKKIDPADFKSKLEVAKSKLLMQRNKRTKPTVDSKIITSWNSIMLKGLADAYAATGDEAYLTKAKQLSTFIETNLLSKDGSLKHSYLSSGISVSGFLEDYAWTAAAFIRLYEVSFEIHWLTLARQLADYSIAHFYNNNSGLFYFSQSLAKGLHNQITETTDKSIPSSNAVIAQVIYKLGIVYTDTIYTNMSLKMLDVVANRAVKMPQYYAQWGQLAGLSTAKSYEVVIVGTDALIKNKTFQQFYLPTCMVMGSTDKEDLPLLQNKLVSDKTLIYVCTNKLCKKPEELVENAVKQVK